MNQTHQESTALSPTEKRALLAKLLQTKTAPTDPKSPPQIPAREMEFSLIYFSSNAAESIDRKYHLLLEGVKFADRHGFTSVWLARTPFSPLWRVVPQSLSVMLCPGDGHRSDSVAGWECGDAAQ